jgi:hypothetical protein
MALMSMGRMVHEGEESNAFYMGLEPTSLLAADR